MRIVVDAMGGDNAPLEIVRGTLNAARKRPETGFILVGREAEVAAAAAACGGAPGNVSVRNAEEVIGMSDDPAAAFRTKKDSSITVGMGLVRGGEGDAFVSAGSTGALLSAGTLIIRRVRGVRRAAMAPVLPLGGKGVVLIDCGANAECTAEYLLQFACLGSFYAERALKIDRPRVALLNIGAEDTKGDRLRLEAYRALREAGDAGRLNFTGNIEAGDAIRGGCDVVVADGFSGNIMLKSIEGAASFLGRELKGALMGGVSSRLGALLARGALRDFKRRLDPDAVGGTAFLGLTKPVIKAHGGSGAAAVESAVAQAVAAVEADIAAAIAAAIEADPGFMRAEGGNSRL